MLAIATRRKFQDWAERERRYKEQIESLKSEHQVVTSRLQEELDECVRVRDLEARRAEALAKIDSAAKDTDNKNES